MSIFFITQILATIFIMAASVYLGYTWGSERHTDIDARAYVRKHYPDQWTAYQRGIREGYAQGLRDGQELPQ